MFGNFWKTHVAENGPLTLPDSSILFFFLETKEQTRIVDAIKPEIRKSNGNLIETMAVQKRSNQETRFTERPNQETRFTERSNQDERFTERSNQETRFAERPKFETENVRIHSGGFPTDSIGSNDRQLSPGFSIVSTDAFDSENLDSESMDSAIGISPTVRRHHYEPLNKVGQKSKSNGNGVQLKK